MKNPNREVEVLILPRDLNSVAQTKSITSESENDWAADFIVGALLYSLLGSNKGEIISGLLPDGDHN